jgi:hypothetical protein
MPEPSDAWVLRAKDGRPCGTCFSIESRHFMTCAHVIDEALRLTDLGSNPEYVGKIVKIQYRGTETDQGTVEATVLHYQRRLSDADAHIVGLERRWSDVVVLRLEDDALRRLAQGQISTWAAVLANPWLLGEERRFHVFGPYAGGARVEGLMKLGDELDGRPLLTRDPGQEATIRGGFSGAPIRYQDGTVLGMCVVANEKIGQARMIPATILQEIAAELRIEVNPYRPGKPPLLKEEELDILKDWTGPIAVVTAGLGRSRFLDRDMVLVIVNCDFVSDYPRKFLSRVGYELAYELGEPDPLEVCEEPIPSNIDFPTIESIVQEYLRQVGLNYGGASGEVLRIAIDRGCRVAHIPDVDLTNKDEVGAAMAILKHWRDGFIRRRPTGKSFCAVLTTREPVTASVLDAFTAQPELSKGFKSFVVGGFRKVTPGDLNEWAQRAYRHVRRIREPVMIQRAKERIYGDRANLTMAEWCDGFSLHGRSIIGAGVND